MVTKDPWSLQVSQPDRELVQKQAAPNKGDNDQVNKPAHYRSHPSGVECIEITEHMNFCLGNAVKYIWRAGLKTDDPIVDLEKARWYIDRELQRLRSNNK